MPANSSGVAAAIVVSHSTNRFDGPNPGHIRIQARHLLARPHEEHPVRRQSSRRFAPTTFSNCCTSAGSCCSERLKLIEQRIDQYRRNKDAEQHRRHRRNPEPEPPLLRRPAYHPEQHHHQQPSDHPCQQKTLRLIPHPASPTLHGQPIRQRNMVPIEPQRSIQQSNRQQK